MGNNDEEGRASMVSHCLWQTTLLSWGDYFIDFVFSHYGFGLIFGGFPGLFHWYCIWVNFSGFDTFSARLVMVYKSWETYS